MLYLFNDKGIHIGTFWYDGPSEYGERFIHFGFHPALGWSWRFIDEFDYWLSDYLANYDGWDGKPPYTVYFQD